MAKFDPSLPLSAAGFCSLDTDDQVAYLLHRGVTEDALPQPLDELDYGGVVTNSGQYPDGFCRGDLEAMLEEIEELESEREQEEEDYANALSDLFDEIEDPESEKVSQLEEAEAAETEAARLQKRAAELHRKAAHLKTQATA